MNRLARFAPQPRVQLCGGSRHIPALPCDRHPLGGLPLHNRNRLAEKVRDLLPSLQ
jgi:hypothetical protein